MAYPDCLSLSPPCFSFSREATAIQFTRYDSKTETNQYSGAGPPEVGRKSRSMRSRRGDNESPENISLPLPLHPFGRTRELFLQGHLTENSSGRADENV